MQSAWTLALVCAASLWATSPARAAFGDPTSRWSFTLQGGGALFGKVEHYADDVRLHSDARAENLRMAFETRASLTLGLGRWFALSAQLGLTNWNSHYRWEGDYRRSNYLTVALAPELRWPIGRGRCAKCPVLFAGPRAGYVVSQRDQRAKHLAVEEDGRFGQGLVLGGRAGAQVMLSRRRTLGLKLEVGFEKVWLRHDVELKGLGHELQRFEIRQPIILVGFWWNL